MKNKKPDLFYWFYENRKTAGIIATVVLILAIISVALYFFSPTKDNDLVDNKGATKPVTVIGNNNDVNTIADIPEPKFNQQILKKNEFVNNVEIGVFSMISGYSTTVKINIISEIQIPKFKVIFKDVNVRYIKPDSYPLNEGSLINFRLGPRPREAENDKWPFIIIFNAQGSYQLTIYTTELIKITESDIVIEHE